MKKFDEKNVAENPLYHDTWKLLKKYRDVVWSLELSVQHVRTKFSPQQLKNVEELIENLRPHIRDISFRTYYRKRREAIEALSSVLWGYTSKDSLDVLEKFFPDLKAGENKQGK